MASIANTKRMFILIAGDLVVYLFSLILTLTVRYGEIPSKQLLFEHLPSFSILFIAFILVGLSAGIYDKQAIFIRGLTSGLLARVQIANAIVGVIFFYFAPLAITPKANLFIYFIVSTILLVLWRMIMFPVVSVSRRQSAVIVGKGEDVEDILEEINRNNRYGLVLKEHVLPKSSIEETVVTISNSMKMTGSSILIVDLHDPTVEATIPYLYSLVFAGVQIIDASKLYEMIFDRIPLTMVKERWFVENSGTALGNRRVYDALKRVMDIVVACFVGALSLVVYPFVYASVKINDGGPLFIFQERIGKNGKIIRIVKFRSMSGNDSGKYGSNGSTIHSVTKVGAVLRNTRIDELPQLWNVLRGDLSLIGPRPELPSLVNIYNKEIPFYNTRHLVKPGLSGWAQIYHENHPHHGVDTRESSNKLSYDLFYVKNRSLILDLKIALRTIQILLKRVGR